MTISFGVRVSDGRVVLRPRLAARPRPRGDAHAEALTAAGDVVDATAFVVSAGFVGPAARLGGAFVLNSPVEAAAVRVSVPGADTLTMVLPTGAPSVEGTITTDGAHLVAEYRVSHDQDVPVAVSIVRHEGDRSLIVGSAPRAGRLRLSLAQLGGGGVRIGIEATDGVHRAALVGAVLAPWPAAVGVVIERPFPDQVLPAAEPVQLAARSTDAHAHDVAGEWTSSRDGTILPTAVGTVLLSPGRHQLQFASDAHGTASVEVLVGPG